MKRLTKRWGEQPYPNLAGKIVCEYKECDSAKSCNDCVHWRIVNRLAAYEDTGLEPEEIVKIREDIENGYVKSTARRYGISVDRLRELAQDDREGRCVVLPCKIGDTVYSSRHERVPDDDYRMSFHIEMRIVSQKFGLIHADCIGKSVFLTREEAEEALKAREQDG